MKNYSITLIVLSILFSLNSHAQEPDSTKQTKIKYLSKDLGLNLTTSEKVVAVMDSYKNDAKTIFNDPQMKDAEKRLKIDQLISKKNESLKQMLTKEQFNKFVPTSEIKISEKKKNTTLNR